MYKGEAGVTRLNALMQAVMNKGEGVKYQAPSSRWGIRLCRPVTTTTRTFIMALWELRRKSILSIILWKWIWQLCDSSVHKLELGDLDLAYATTVHKAQGSSISGYHSAGTYSRQNVVQEADLYGGDPC